MDGVHACNRGEPLDVLGSVFQVAVLTHGGIINQRVGDHAQVSLLFHEGIAAPVMTSGATYWGLALAVPLTDVMVVIQQFMARTTGFNSGGPFRIGKGRGNQGETSQQDASA